MAPSVGGLPRRIHPTFIRRTVVESFVAELAQELMGIESEVTRRADHRQDALTKRQPAHRLTGEAGLAPDHIGAQGAFCGIVG